MKISEPSLSKILEINQFIKGNFDIKESDLKNIFSNLKKKQEKLIKEESYQRKKIEDQYLYLNKIKIELKRNNETLQKLFFSDTNKISLIYKKQVGSYYIKARFYWNGKQREVQVGSLPNVIDIVNILIDENIIINIRPIDKNNLSWDQVVKHDELINAIKRVALAKSHEYIIKRLLINNFSTKIKNKNVKKKIDSNVLLESDIANEEVNENKETAEDQLSGIKWYENWRKDNL